MQTYPIEVQIFNTNSLIRTMEGKMRKDVQRGGEENQRADRGSHLATTIPSEWIKQKHHCSATVLPILCFLVPFSPFSIF